MQYIKHASLVAAVILLCAVPFKASTAQVISCAPPMPNGFKECVVGIDLAKLTHVAAQQQKSEWCWAASISMVFKYYGYSLSQDEIVKHAYGSVINMPGQPHQLTSALNTTWKDQNGRIFKGDAVVYDVQANMGDMSVLEVAAALQQGLPVIIGASGHAMVLTAMKFIVPPTGGIGAVTYARVIDPWTGTARQLDPGHSFVTYAAIVSTHALQSTPNGGTLSSKGTTPIASSNDFCQDLKKAVSLSGSKFISVRGAASGNGWDSTFIIAGSKSCSIQQQDDGEIDLYCSRSDAYNDIVYDANNCLSGWLSSESKKSDGRMRAEFKASQGATTVRIWEVKKGGVALDISDWNN